MSDEILYDNEANHLLAGIRDALRDELERFSDQLVLLREELQKRRLAERARRLQADLGFRGDLGWQCLRCGQDFRTLRDAETHLFLSSHCRKCGRALPEATTAAASALCEFCSSAFMQLRLKRRLGKGRLPNVRRALDLVRQALDSGCDIGCEDIETLHQAEALLANELGNPPWSRGEEETALAPFERRDSDRNTGVRREYGDAKKGASS